MLIALYIPVPFQLTQQKKKWKLDLYMYYVDER